MTTTKAHILREIKRTTTANGGVPLGSRKFKSETRIRRSDWCGKFWARWSDALREAGFEPNKRTEAHGESELLRMYAKLSLQLGRLPSDADIRLQIANGLKFPSWNTYTKRFGTKPQFVARLRKYCQGQADYEAVVAFCDTYVSREPEEPDGTNLDGQQAGFVYLIKHGNRCEYKIGRTSNPLRREGEIAFELPERVHPVHTIETDDPAGIETYWHKRFANRRKNGEWFQLSRKDVAAFKRRKFM